MNSEDIFDVLGQVQALIDKERTIDNLAEAITEMGVTQWIKENARPGSPLQEIPEQIKGAGSDIPYKYAIVVGSTVNYNKAKMLLGPMAALGLPVWVNTDFASKMKENNDKIDFRRWIKPFTAHNEKMGLNTSVLQKKFTTTTQEVQLTSSSQYQKFAEVAKRVVGYSKVFPKFSAKNVPVEQIISQRRANPNFQTEYANDQFAGPIQGYAITDPSTEEQVHSLQRVVKDLMKDNDDLRKNVNEVRAETAQQFDVSKLKHAKHVTDAFSYIKEKMEITGSDPEHHYKVAVAAPFTQELEQVRQPSYSNVKTLALQKKNTIPFTIQKPYAMLIYNMRAGSMDPFYFVQSDTNFFQQPTDNGLAVPEEDANQQLTPGIVITAGGSSFLTAAGDADLIANGTIVVSEPFGYGDLLETVRPVAGGIRLHKTSKSDNEAGSIRCMYNAVGDQYSTSSISEFARRQQQTDQYKEFFPAEHDHKTGGFICEVSYVPQNPADLDMMYDSIDKVLTQEERVFHSSASEIAQNTVGCIAYRSTAAANQRFIYTDFLYQPHNVIFLFQGVTAGMSFQLETRRFMEGSPGRAGRLIQSSSCKLSQHDSALALLRSHEFRDDKLLNAVKKLKPDMTDQELGEAFAGFGILSLPLIKAFKDIAFTGLRAMAAGLTPQGILLQLLPRVAQLLVHKITDDKHLADKAKNDLSA